MSIDVTIRDLRLTTAFMATAQLIKGDKSDRCEGCGCRTKTHLAGATGVARCALCKSCFKTIKEEVKKPHYQV